MGVHIVGPLVAPGPPFRYSTSQANKIRSPLPRMPDARWANLLLHLERSATQYRDFLLAASKSVVTKEYPSGKQNKAWWRRGRALRDDCKRCIRAAETLLGLGTLGIQKSLGSEGAGRFLSLRIALDSVPRNDKEAWCGDVGARVDALLRELVSLRRILIDAEKNISAGGRPTRRADDDFLGSLLTFYKEASGNDVLGKNFYAFGKACLEPVRGAGKWRKSLEVRARTLKANWRKMLGRKRGGCL